MTEEQKNRLIFRGRLILIGIILLVPYVVLRLLNQ